MKKKIKHTPVLKTTYPNFGKRSLAFFTDLFMIGIPISLIVMALFGYDTMHSAGGIDLIVDPENAKKNAPSPISSIAQLALSFAIYLFFWRSSGQTPGKKMLNMKIVDAKTLQNGTTMQLIIRFIGYFISAITIFGFFIGLFRKDNRSLHDILSRTVVINTEE